MSADAVTQLRRYGSLLITGSNNFLLGFYLAAFSKYSFQMVQNRYIWLLFLRLPPGVGSQSWDDLRKIFRMSNCQQMAKVPNGVETLPKNLTG